MSAACITHGTRAGYRRGCRCTPCRAAAARERARLRRTPGTPLISTDRAIEHLHTLASQGVGAPQVAKLAHVHRVHVCDIRAGRIERAHAETVARLLAVRPVLALHQRVPAEVPNQHLSELREEGYTARQIATLTGLCERAISRIAHHPDGRVTVRTAIKLRRFVRYARGEES